jgi:hypothetical protein
MIGGGDADERPARGDFGDASTRSHDALVFTDFRVVQRAIDMEMKVLLRRSDCNTVQTACPPFTRDSPGS